VLRAPGADQRTERREADRAVEGQLPRRAGNHVDMAATRADMAVMRAMSRAKMRVTR